MQRFVLGLAAFALLGVSTGRAELIVGTEPEGSGGFGVGFSFQADVNLVVGQEFALNGPTNIHSITLYLDGDETNDPQADFTLYVTDEIGSTADASNVLLTQIGTFPAGPLPTGHAPVTFDNLGLALAAGTYYLVVSSDAGPGSGWGFDAAVLPSSLGTVGNGFVGIVVGGAVGDYRDVDPGNPNEFHANFRINAVPEPGSVMLLLSGSAIVLAFRFVRRGV